MRLYRAGLLLPTSTHFVEPVMGQASTSLTLIVLFFAQLACSLKSCILFTFKIIIWEARFQFYQFIILTNGVPHFPAEISHDRLTFLASRALHWRLSCVESAGRVFTETKQGQLRSAGEAYQTPELSASVSSTASVLSAAAGACRTPPWRLSSCWESGLTARLSLLPDLPLTVTIQYPC